MCMHNILQKNSNTTLVKVKYNNIMYEYHVELYSNTTLVKVKLSH